VIADERRDRRVYVDRMPDSGRKLIIGYQTTEQGKDALALGRLLSEATASTPVVAMVFTWPHGLMTAAERESNLQRESHGPLTAAADALSDLRPQTTAIADLSPAGALATLAEDERAWVIVVGSCHRGGIGRLLVGDTGASLVHGAPCAVAVAPLGFRDHRSNAPLNLAVAFDGSPESWSALETGIGIAQHVGGCVTVLTVADSGGNGYAAAWSILSAGELRDHEREDKDRVLELALAASSDRVAVEGRLLSGDPGTALQAASGEFDLLLAGSRRYGPLRRVILGSTTRRLVDGAECPVLIVPRANATDRLGLRARAAAFAPAIPTYAG
jgi:nucleotide-binding universal stress UspA family protein